MDVTQAAGSVRKDATDGIGAPQVGLDPRYPSSAEHWDHVKARYPGAAGAYEPCVDDYLQATQAIKQVAPLTRRPAWDVSGKQVNGAIQQAADLVTAGDKCMGQVQQGPSPTRAPDPNYGPIMTPVLAPPPPPPGSTPPPPSPVLQGGVQSGQPLSGGTTGYPPQQSVPPWNPAPAQPRYAYTSIQYRLGTRLATQNICITWNAPTTTNGTNVTFDLTPSGTVQFYVKASGLLYTNAIRLTQLIDVYGQAHSFNATLTFTESPCPP